MGEAAGERRVVSTGFRSCGRDPIRMRRSIPQREALFSARPSLGSGKVGTPTSDQSVPDVAVRVSSFLGD